MTDFVYHFKKGEGWVLGPNIEIAERVISNTRIRLERRLPALGEKIFTMRRDETLEDVMEDLATTTWRQMLMSTIDAYNSCMSWDPKKLPYLAGDPPECFAVISMVSVNV